MLRLVFGRSGSGKTHWTREFLAEESRRDSGGLFLIVPEQYSFESEKAILRRIGPRLARKIQVMSFSRLAQEVFRTYGGLAGARLGDGGRAALMQMAIEEAADHLRIYRGAADRGDFVSVMLAAVDEMKLCGIDPDTLRAAGEKAGEAQLREKAGELSLVYGLYEALVGQSFVDPKDDLARMCGLLEGKDFFRDSVVVIDAFSGFTVQEYRAIRYMLGSARDVYITLCADGPGGKPDPADPFYAPRRTASRLVLMARQAGAQVAKPLVLEGGRRFASPELAFLEEYLFRPVGERFEQAPGDIFLYQAEDVYDESEFAASTIQNLVMEGARYRDFAVIFRSAQPYLGILNTALENRGIPFFMDMPENIHTKPLIRMVIAGFESVLTGLRSEHVLAFLKTGLTAARPEDISELENYVAIWRLSGGKWRQDWQGHPDGFGHPADGVSTERLACINALRRQVVEWLSSFEREVADASGTRMAEAVYRLLESVGARERLLAQVRQLEERGEEEEARLCGRLWDALMHVLDQLHLTVGDRKLPLRRFLSLFQTMMESETLGEIPMGLDQVTVAAADRMRLSQPKIVLVMGASMGQFPLTPSGGGIFSQRERDELKKLGVELNRTLDDSCAEERLIAYQAMSAPSHKLYISYSAGSGESAYPSELVSGTKGLFPSLPTRSRRDLGELYFINSAPAAFENAAKIWQEPSVKAETLRSYFRNRPDYQARIASLERALSREPFRIRSQETARSLFGRGHRLSASQIEVYHQCRFRYFCYYGLRVRERRTAKLDPMQYGSLIHFLFEKMFMDVGSRKIMEMKDIELAERIRRLIDDYARENFGGQEDKGERFRSVLERTARSAVILIRHVAEELSQSAFVPVGFEQKVGEEGIPLTIPLPDGRQVSMTGSIDRVDAMEAGEESYVRVIDYKTGGKDFQLSDVLDGLNLQMLIYLAALIESKKVSPAGVLYMPAKRPSVSAERRNPPEKARKKADESLCMKGVILGEGEEMIRSMEKEAAGQYIPVSIKKEKISGEEYLLTREEFYEIARYIKKKIARMAQRLQQGEVDASPLLRNHLGCSFCPYGSVCGRERTEDDVMEEKISKQEFFERLRGEEEDG